jgi:hypothetical protein
MKIRTAFILLVTSLMICQCGRNSENFRLRGSWYYGRPTDGLPLDYTELYFNDTTYYPQSETFGQWYHPEKYKLTKDSIYYLDRGDKKFVSYYKILTIKNDTLFLRPSQRVTPANDIYWVRLPENEKGHYDHSWAGANADSLNYAIRNDWHRRMIRYHMFLNNDLKTYDSLVAAGFWKFNMKNVAEEKSRQ